MAAAIAIKTVASLASAPAPVLAANANVSAAPSDTHAAGTVESAAAAAPSDVAVALTAPTVSMKPMVALVRWKETERTDALGQRWCSC